jgi:O-antigen ligase
MNRNGQQPFIGRMNQRRGPAWSYPPSRSFGPRPRFRLWQSREAFFSDAFLFAVGAAGVYSLNLVGALPGDEVLILAALPFLLLTRARRAFPRQYLWFYLLAAGWLLGTLIADVHAGTPMPSRMKGTARVVFLILDFIALAVMINGKTRRYVIFALSIVAVMLYYVYQFRGAFLLQWKFGLCTALTILSLLVASYFYAKRNYWAAFGISAVLAWLNLIYAFRSQMAIVLIAAALTLPIFDQEHGRQSRLVKSVKVILLLTFACGAAYTANWAIKTAADRGFFDESLSAKFQTQSEGKLGVLVGGRPETLVAIQAIRDSPILGHGSFPVDPKYLEMKQDIQYEYGYTESDTPEDIPDPVIPTHSHLTMAWVESGIFGGLLWTYILAVTILAMLQISFRRPFLAPLYCYLLMNFVWDNLYSPLGSVNRLWAAYLVLLSYHLLKEPAARLRPQFLQKGPIHASMGNIGKRRPMLAAK